MSAIHPSDQPTQVFTPESTSETCRSCGSGVSREQRYCLSCGQRRTDKKVPFADTLAPEPEAAAATSAKAASGLTPAMGAAIVCASVLFLGVGVLVGRSNGSGANQAAVPQQVQTIAADAAGAGTADAGAASGAAAKKSATDGQAKAAAPPVLSGAAADAVKKAAECKTPTECQEASKKIPNQFTTPGKPPPADGKAPAGGATGQTFQ
jgi:hypothetical protein